MSCEATPIPEALDAPVTQDPLVAEFEKLGFADCRRINTVTLPETVCDLHGHSVEGGLSLLQSFLNFAKKKNIPEMLVITGKGVHSEGGFSLLKLIVERQLTDMAIVQKIHSFSRLIERDRNYGSFIVRI